ncbi:hypothetical protein CYANOKiyG1_42680 [Okeania sp. KiyG1]|nr:hypothetical protein CYANOKiyG1_42680 [Okeania sp. KiyG1]
MPIPQLREIPDYYSQKRDLVNTKDKFPYKKVADKRKDFHFKTANELLSLI